MGRDFSLLATTAGRSNARDLTQRLRRIAPEGITEGSLYVPENFMTLPVLQ